MRGPWVAFSYVEILAVDYSRSAEEPLADADDTVIVMFRGSGASPLRPLFVMLLLLAVAAGHGEEANDPLPVLWPAAELPWLAGLHQPGVLAELRAIATHDQQASSSTFGSHFNPSWDLARPAAESWSSLDLMNKGQLLAPGCRAAPLTCAVLASTLLLEKLAPIVGVAEEVGVRLLKLDAGASLETHVGPGGRLVAHLGVQIPDGARLRLGNDTILWHEGEFTIFDDSLPHSVRNDGKLPRYILHLAFPHPAARGATHATIIATTGTPSFTYSIASDCTTVVTNLHNGLASVKEPFVKLYNNPHDNQPTDFSACISASLLHTTTDPAVPKTLHLRLQAAHGYGSIDISVTPSANFVTFELVSLTTWAAPPASRHISFALSCPVDMCPLPNATAPPAPPGWGIP